ncbi:unnamed protein product, partial [Nesidiocoris tenuis]
MNKSESGIGRGREALRAYDKLNAGSLMNVAKAATPLAGATAGATNGCAGKWLSAVTGGKVRCSADGRLRAHRPSSNVKRGIGYRSGAGCLRAHDKIPT